ncbi:hypothetical protein [Cohnella faecalis]|uniref:Extracellular solute-binding protein n=1 Tax=Cohnella faecalis TaxID=2315694 RepID=A0A398CNK5_9BACL|nr:hypothetical protein [Cohnella faecalis]RIE01161.1 hypothetical protein D3H35_22415 [Cohnella faecalis]
MLKRSVITSLVFTLVLVLAACGSGNNNEKQTPAPTATETPSASPSSAGVESAGDIEPEPGAKLLVWDGKDGVPFLKEIAKQFTAEYGIPVEVQEQGGPSSWRR